MFLTFFDLVPAKITCFVIFQFFSYISFSRPQIGVDRVENTDLIVFAFLFVFVIADGKIEDTTPATSGRRQVNIISN